MIRYFGTVAIFVCFLTQATRGDELADYLDFDGQLKAKVVFAEANTTRISWDGCRFEIERSGDWAKYCGRHPNPVSKGKLSPKQISALAQTLANQDFSQLPKRMGWEPKVDPTNPVGYKAAAIAISVGEKETCFYLQKDKYEYIGQPDSAETRKWFRFVAVELLLRDLLMEDFSKKDSK